METRQIKYSLVCPVCNAYGPYERLHLDKEFRLERWDKDRFFAYIKDNLSDDLHRESDLYDTVLDSNDDTSIVIVGTPDISDPPPDFKSHYIDHYIRAFHVHQERLSKKLSLIRAFRDGNLREFAWWWHGNDGSSYQSNNYSYATCVRDYSPLTDSEIQPLDEFLASTSLPLERPYLRLALDNYDDAYETTKRHLQLLSLIISLEAIFNVGQQELTYRISRGAAVLLGADVDAAEDLFQFIKSMYEKRSSMVHKGDATSVAKGEIERLRKISRQAILKTMTLNVDKIELDRILRQSAFGARL